jgi:hypothetical protein
MLQRFLSVTHFVSYFVSYPFAPTKMSRITLAAIMQIWIAYSKIAFKSQESVGLRGL